MKVQLAENNNLIKRLKKVSDEKKEFTIKYYTVHSLIVFFILFLHL